MTGLLIDRIDPDAILDPDLRDELELELAKGTEAREILDAVRLAVEGASNSVTLQAVIRKLLDGAVITEPDLGGSSSVERLLLAIREAGGRLEVPK